MPLYPFQEVSALFLARTAGVLDCSEMGVGKSCVTLSALRCLHELGRDPLPGVIICPNSVKHHWANEAATWCPAATPYIISGSAAQRRKLLQTAAEDPAALVIVNYEAVKLHSRLAPYGSVRLVKCKKCGGFDPEVTETKCQRHPKELQAVDWKTVIVDEAHRMKDPKSQQTRACWAVQHHETVTRRWALTGTPVANDVGDLWSIMHGVAPADFPTKSKFIERFALVAWNPFAALDIVGVKPANRAEFDRIVQPRLRRVLKDVVLPNLPPKVRVVREAPMTSKQARAYREMETEMMATLDDGSTVMASRNLVKATRLLQFSSAYAQVNEDLTLALSEPSPKLDVMMEVLEELGGRQVAVCALSRQLIELAAARLDAVKPRPISYRLLTGTVPVHERPRNIEDFQAGRARCMLFTLQAGGVGVTLTAADTIVFLQRSWSMVDNRQAEDRVHRVGSEAHESVTIIDVVAPDTIEVKQLQTLLDKVDRQEEIVRDFDRLRAAGLEPNRQDYTLLHAVLG